MTFNCNHEPKHQINLVREVLIGVLDVQLLDVPVRRVLHEEVDQLLGVDWVTAIALADHEQVEEVLSGEKHLDFLAYNNGKI